MTPDAFRRWRERMGFDEHQAAEALGLSLDDAVGYEHGYVSPIPETVRLRCLDLLAKVPATDPLQARTDELRDFLIGLFPDADPRFLTSLYLNDEDGKFGECGLLSAFTDHYLQRIDDFQSPQVAALFERLEAIMAADTHRTDPMANAVATCFLENISSTQAGEAGRPLMGPATLQFFMGWHRPPAP